MEREARGRGGVAHHGEQVKRLSGRGAGAYDSTPAGSGGRKELGRHFASLDFPILIVLSSLT